MNERGQYGRAAHDRVGAEPPPPVRQVLIDALDKLRRDRQVLVVKIQENEARLKVALDMQTRFEHPITNNILRMQFEALQREGSALAADLVVAKRSLSTVEGQIQDVSARIERSTGRPPPPMRPSSPSAKRPSRSPREDREEPRPSPSEEPPARVARSSDKMEDKTVLYAAGGVAVVVFLGIALAQKGDRV